MNRISRHSLIGVGLLALMLSACAPDMSGKDAKPATDTATAPEAAPAEAAPAPAPAPKPVVAPAPAPHAAAPRPKPAPQICVDCGTVLSINEVQEKGSGTGAGAMAGAVAGGVAGHQFGKGRGKDAATVAGAILGALAGNEIEKNVRTEKSYAVTIGMEDGTQRVINVTDLGGVVVGAKVRVQGDMIYLR